MDDLLYLSRESVGPHDINIPIRYAGQLYSSIKQYGVTEDVFRNTNIPLDLIHEQEYFIHFPDFLTLCRNAIEQAGTTEIAVEFGVTAVLPSHGAWGLAVMTAPTLYEAIMLFKRYATLELPFFIFDYQEVGDHVVVAIRETDAIRHHREFHLEHVVIAEAINFLYALQDSSDLEVFCSYAPPDYADRYSKIINRPVYFNSAFTGVRFHRKHLVVPMPDENHASHQMLLKSLEDAKVRKPAKFSMKESIMQFLDAMRFRYPDQETVAKELNVSPRKLRYCLKDENTTYKSIVSDLKKRDAYQCLSEGMSIGQVALELGYDDPSNFTRAFRKWYGVSPSDFRAIRK